MLKVYITIIKNRLKKVLNVKFSNVFSVSDELRTNYFNYLWYLKLGLFPSSLAGSA